MSESLTLYKLIILYMLDKVNFPLTNAQLSAFILEKEYTNYFTLQQAISELIDSQLIGSETVRNTSQYAITEEGQNTLSYFQNKISEPIKMDIDTYLQQNKYQLRNEVAIFADYFKTTNQEFEVRCGVKEKHSNLIEMTLTVPDKEQAAAICNNWNKKNQQIYDYIVRELM